MCGRFAFTTPVQAVLDLFALAFIVDFLPRWNIAPTQQAAVVRRGRQGRQLDLLRWGLVPPWARDPSVAARMINARSEEAATKPAFRAAMRARRCLVPADGFYEWTGPKARRQPLLLHPRDGVTMAFAGLWERWGDLETFTILTTSANDTLAPFHDRMPAILPPPAWEEWLDPHTPPDDVQAMLHPAPEGLLTVTPVGPAVNNPRNEGPELWDPLPAPDLR